MKILLTEDDFTSRKTMQIMLRPYGEIDVAVNGIEAIDAFKESLNNDEVKPYDVIFLDIMMPEMDGQEALKEIRKIEMEVGIVAGDSTKIIMTTALDDSKNIMNSFREQCDGYLVKPVSKNDIKEKLEELGLN